MTIHRTTQEVPEVCTVERLIALLSDMDLATPVFIATGEREDGGLDVATVSSVTQLREPLQGSETCLIVPSGALGRWFEELQEIEAAVDGAGNGEPT